MNKIFEKIQMIGAKLRGGEHFLTYLRKKGILIGDNCRIFSDISTTESYLITIDDGTTISSNVVFITHDASIQKVIRDSTDLFGRINIGKNCFIGSNSIIMYGVTLADNTIVAAGSVVTKSVKKQGVIIGGNPARIIGDIDSFSDKSKNYAVNINGMTPEQKRQLLNDESLLVKR